MQRQWTRALTLCAFFCVAAGCGVSASSTGLTKDFVEEGKAALSYMQSDLIPAVGTARFADAIASSRARVKLVQSKVKNDVDKDVWLILALINVKTYELNGHKEMAGLPAMQTRTARRATEELTNERDACMSEADGWVNGTLMLRVLQSGPCLQQGRQAAAILKLK